MNAERLTLRSLRITDGDLPVAEVGLSPGLNLIIGASDTGKTFVFEAIDFMLGAKDPLRGIPESAGYSQAFLDVEPSSGPPFTLRRGLAGGDVEVTEFLEGRDGDVTAVSVLRPTGSADADESLSAYSCEQLAWRAARSGRTHEGKSKVFRSGTSVASPW
jgi:hypothetical protein